MIYSERLALSYDVIRRVGERPPHHPPYDVIESFIWIRLQKELIKIPIITKKYTVRKLGG